MLRIHQTGSKLFHCHTYLEHSYWLLWYNYWDHPHHLLLYCTVHKPQRSQEFRPYCLQKFHRRVCRYLHRSLLYKMFQNTKSRKYLSFVVVKTIYNINNSTPISPFCDITNIITLHVENNTWKAMLRSGVWPWLYKHEGTVVPAVHWLAWPHLHTPLRHLVAIAVLQAELEPHLQVPASHVSVKPLHVGLHTAIIMTEHE